MIDRLNVSLDFGTGRAPRTLGQLGRDLRNRSFAFEWDPAFTSDPLPIWPIRLKSLAEILRSQPWRRRSVPGLFEDSLPDGWGKLLLEREISASAGAGTMLDDIERLAFVGRRGLGALCYTPGTTPQHKDDIDLEWFENVVSRVEDGASIEELQTLRAISGGSQGARPKFVAQIDACHEILRDHRNDWEPGWSHVLIKGRGASDPPGSIEVELAYGQLLKMAGVQTSPMFPIQGRDETFFATERFDRKGSGRRHMATVAGLLDTNLQHGVFDYTQFMRLTKAMCRDKSHSAEELFRRMVFNVRANSRDDHIRNHAFLMDKSGHWHLSPAYDVTFDLGPAGAHSMAVANNSRNPAREEFGEVARIGGIKPKRRDTIIDEVDSTLARWPDVAKEFDVPKTKRDEINSTIQSHISSDFNKAQSR
ncbi:MAG: type II toxin-antitoxin system HipA family toxin [Shimia sp.]|nr:type II toxin-antitoxin system HipA family toxin [Shimia sp.]